MTLTAATLALLVYGFAGTAFLTAVSLGPHTLLKKLLDGDRSMQMAADIAPAVVALVTTVTWLLILLVWPLAALGVGAYHLLAAIGSDERN